MLDDHSRYAVGVWALAGTHGAPVQAALVRCFEQYGLPEAMLMDHGIPWWCPANGHGLTAVSVALLNQGIDVVYSGVRHPQTQGKIERFHRTLGRRLRQWGVPTTLGGFADALDRFRVEYNDVRPHEALALQPPSTRYRPSRRPYQPRPPAWVYPADLAVERVDRTGAIRYGGRRYFVCHALAGEWVGCQPFDDRLLVTFRHLHVREINVRTGRTRPLCCRVGHHG